MAINLEKFGFSKPVQETGAVKPKIVLDREKLKEVREAIADQRGKEKVPESATATGGRIMRFKKVSAPLVEKVAGTIAPASEKAASAEMMEKTHTMRPLSEAEEAAAEAAWERAARIN